MPSPPDSPPYCITSNAAPHHTDTDTEDEDNGAGGSDGDHSGMDGVQPEQQDEPMMDATVAPADSAPPCVSDFTRF